MPTITQINFIIQMLQLWKRQGIRVKSIKAVANDAFRGIKRTEVTIHQKDSQQIC